MKKIIAIGASTVALAALPAMAAFATVDPVQDTINITINPSCTLTRAAYSTGGTGTDSSHKNGTGTGAGSWSADTLSAIMSSGTVNENLGSSQFRVVCNKFGSYSVTVATTSLAVSGGSQTPIPNNTTYSASVSGWSPIYDTTKKINGDTIKSYSASTEGDTFEVTYGAGISATQATGTYTGTATYSLTDI